MLLLQHPRAMPSTHTLITVLATLTGDADNSAIIDRTGDEVVYMLEINDHGDCHGRRIVPALGIVHLWADA